MVSFHELTISNFDFLEARVRGNPKDLSVLLTLIENLVVFESREV